jgi:high-affinity nickel-transport protein
MAVRSEPAPPAAQQHRIWFTRGEWARLGGLFGFVAFLHVLGWGLFLYYAARYHEPGFAGAGALAYTFGLRHAFDADHIAAIDDTTRFMLQKGKRPLGVGFFFSLGHSSVVFALAAAVALAANAVRGHIDSWHTTGGIIGATVSGVFLYVVAILNLIVLVGIVRLWQQMKQGGYDREQLEELLVQRGFMNRLLGRRFRNFINASWQMYPVGFLFGLGFDTASEIALLAITGAAATSGHLPGLAIISLPILFAAGMSALDTADGAFMAKAYGWAFASPLRKMYYNITTTGLSVAVALVIGSIELIGVLGHQLKLSGGLWGFIGRLGDDFELFGYIIVGMFLVTWAGSVILWKTRRIEERWGSSVS